MENLGLNGRINWKISKISSVERITVLTKWKISLLKILCYGRESIGVNAELNSLSNSDKFRWRICVTTAKETGKKGKFNSYRRIQLWENENFSYQKFVLSVEENSERMQNLILFQTVTNSDVKFGFERENKLKNKQNFIRGADFSFYEMKIFPIKNSSSS